MPYRILTYQDPYHLDKTSFWEEIQWVPHFCASSVMAQSLWDLYCEHSERETAIFFWPLDKLCDLVYKDWTKNIERKLQQHIMLSKRLDELREKDRQNPEPHGMLYEAMMQNRGELIDALRMFVELDIEPASLHDEMATPEQKVFIDLFRDICYSEESNLRDAFSLDDNVLTKSGLWLQFFTKTIDDEKKRQAEAAKKLKEGADTQAENVYQKRLHRIAKLEQILCHLQKTRSKKIVVHGIHQFKPIQLRLISALEKQGYEIIFLYNYLPQFAHIYGTWERLYGLFDIPAVPDGGPGVQLPLWNTESYQLAEAFAGVLEPQMGAEQNLQRKNWIRIAGNVKVVRYESTSEMANETATVIRKYQDKQIREGKVRPDGYLSLAGLPEKTYATSKDADEILKVIFPKYAGDRHFLNYPIGQFFTSLYRMWDEEKHYLVLDTEGLRACVSSGFVMSKHCGRLAELISIVAPMLSDVHEYGKVKERLEHYKDAFRDKAYESNPLKKELKLAAFYNDNLVQEEDIELLITYIKDLEKDAEELFGRENHFDFKSHFSHLREYIIRHADDLAGQEEKELIQGLLARFEGVTEATKLSGPMEEIRQGLFYYLKQKEQEDPEWVIRNFEQIEGDVLRSARQAGKAGQGEDADGEIIYHFAGLSDRMFSQRVDDLLPWPLTDHFVHSVYSPNALVFQLYYTSLSEVQDYKRYALFYGLYFNRGRVKLSYIRHIDQNAEEQLYYPLRVLNIQEVPSQTPTAANGTDHGMNIEPSDCGGSLAFSSKYHMMDFFLCPYKYYLDFVCATNIKFDTPYLINRFYGNILISLLWKEKAGKKLTVDQLQEALKTIQEDELDRYFPFLRSVNDKPDIRSRALNYIVGYLLQNKGLPDFIQAYQGEHEEIRDRFARAQYWTDPEKDQVHPVKEMEEWVELKNKDDVSYRVYGLHKFSQKNQNVVAVEAAQQAIGAYLAGETHGEHSGAWCDYCSYKPLCKKPYEVKQG